MKKAVVFNLGCKVNQYECDVLATGLAAQGYETSEKLVPADVYIVNTCAVTAEAERKSRQILSRIRALNPDAYIVVCGCASQKNADFFVEHGVQCVSGVAGKDTLLDRIGTLYNHIEDLPKSYEASDTLPSGARTRAYVKIQDGCNNFCSYCIIPYLRGAPRSKPVALAAAEIRALANRTKEIVITGINLSHYGKENGESLASLMRAVADVPARIRLGSFYVEGINEELLEVLFALKDFCPHFHLSLQNGDDKVLRDMNRRYTRADYLERVALIRRFDPNAAITTDIIVGFPTETEESFANTLAFVKEAAFSDIHIFPYSKRDGTAAAKYPSLPPETIKERVKRLQAARALLRQAYLNRMLGVSQNVIFEENKGKFSEGYSQYYIRCYADRLNSVDGRAIIIPEEIFGDGLKGKIIEE